MFPTVVVVSILGLTILLYAILSRDAPTWVVMLIGGVVMGALTLLFAAAKGHLG